jgi:hypothetical protein
MNKQNTSQETPDNEQQVLTLNIKGLYTNNNRFSVAPDEPPKGSLQIAKNIVLDRVSVAETRRGQTFYGTQLNVGTGNIDQLLQYRNTLLVNYNGTLAYDSDDSGTWVNYTGTFVPPTANGLKTKMKNILAQGNNYITTTKGVYVQDSITTSPLPAGVPLPLSASGTIIGTTGYLGTNTAVSYQIVIGTTDSNTNLKLSVPSNIAVITNPNVNVQIISSTGTTITVGTSAGILVGDQFSQLVNSYNAIVTNIVDGSTITVNGSYAWTAGNATSGHNCNVDVNFILPQGLGTNYFYQIYRGDQAATANTTPDVNCQLVQQANFTSADLTAGTITWLDSRPDSFRGANLYTNQSEQGALATNNPPPYCTDMTIFDGYCMYANCAQKNTLTFTLIGAGSPGLSYINTTGTITTGTTITGIPDTTGINVGMAVIGSNIPANTTVTHVDSSTQVSLSNTTTANESISVLFQDIITIANTKYYASNIQDPTTNQFKVVSNNLSIGQNITNTANNLIACINLSPANNQVYAINISGAATTPGQIEIQERLIAGTTFYVTSTNGSAFNPILPATGTTIASTNDARQNRIYISKYLQPEAVPVTSNIDVGSRDYPILRIITLATSVFVFKEDGNYLLVDQGGGNFALSLNSNNTICLVPESVQVIDNLIYLYSTQGIVAISPSTGAVIKSFCIEDQLLNLSSGVYPTFQPVSFGVTYESNRKYLFYTVSSTLDTTAQQAYVYNYVTDAWTNWDTPRTCGLVLIRDQRLYTGHPTNGYVYQERKSLDSITNEDFADEEYQVNITSYDSAYNVYLTSTNNLVKGMTLSQDYLNAIITNVVSPTQITVDLLNPWREAAAKVYTPISVELQFIPESCKNVGLMKSFDEVTLIFLKATFPEIDFITSTNFARGNFITPLQVYSGIGWGEFPWGTEPWGGGTDTNQEIRTYIPMPNTQGLYINLGLNLNRAFSNLSFEGLSLIYNPISTRFK